MNVTSERTYLDNIPPFPSDSKPIEISGKKYTPNDLFLRVKPYLQAAQQSGQGLINEVSDMLRVLYQFGQVGNSSERMTELKEQYWTLVQRLEARLAGFQPPEPKPAWDKWQSDSEKGGAPDALPVSGSLLEGDFMPKIQPGYRWDKDTLVQSSQPWIKPDDENSSRIKQPFDDSGNGKREPETDVESLRVSIMAWERDHGLDRPELPPLQTH